MSRSFEHTTDLLPLICKGEWLPQKFACFQFSENGKKKIEEERKTDAYGSYGRLLFLDIIVYIYLRSRDSNPISKVESIAEAHTKEHDISNKACFRNTSSIANLIPSR